MNQGTPDDPVRGEPINGGDGYTVKEARQFEYDQAAMEQRSKVIQLRIAGFSYQKIAQIVGCTSARANKMVLTAIDELQNITRERAADLRAITHMRCEAMINRLWILALPTKPVKNPLTGEPELPPPDLQAMGMISKLMDQDARIMGYSSPERMTVDASHLNSQISIVVEMISRVIPDESRQRVYEAVDQAMMALEHREKTGSRDKALESVVDV